MEKIKITFLGTASAIPTKTRNHSSILVELQKEDILVECGEGTQRQLKIAGISPFRISKILISHLHGDHVLGLPGLLQTLHFLEYKKTMQIYGPKGTKSFISKLKKLYRLKIPLEVIEISKTFIETPEIKLSALEMKHGVPSLAYSIELKSKLRLNKSKLKKLKLPNSPLLKKLQQGKSIKFYGKTIKPSQVAYSEPGKKIAIIMDTSPNSNAIKLARDSDILISESTFSSLQESEAKHKKHLTSTQAAEIAKKAKVKILYLTHIGQQFEAQPEKILKEAKSVFKNTHLAKDFQSLEL